MKTKAKLSDVLLKSLIVIVFLAIIILSVVWLLRNEKSEPDSSVVLPDEPDQHTVLITPDHGLVSEETVIDVSVVQDGLRDMDILITEEYFFTEVISQSSSKEFFNIKIPWTKSSYIASYDGTVSAGIDFSGIKVTCNEKMKTITVFLPKSSVQNVVIDPDSFVLYEEKTGIANPFSIEDYNNSQIALKKLAQNKAIKRGVLQTADENAERLITNFINGLLDTSEYTLQFNRGA